MRAARGADMLVVGSQGYGGFTAALLGSVSTACIMPPARSWSSEGPAGTGNDQHRRQFQDMRNQPADASLLAFLSLTWALPGQEGGVLRHPIVLMHNQPTGNPATVSALPAIIQFFRSRGYRFVAL